MRRVISLLSILLFVLPLSSAPFVFETTGTEGDIKFEGGEATELVTWDLTNLSIKGEKTFWFKDSSGADLPDGGPIDLEPTLRDGQFVGYGEFSFNWRIISLDSMNVSLYLGGPMTSDTNQSLDWILKWDDPKATGDNVPESVLGTIGETITGSGYGKTGRIEVVDHNPEKTGILSESSISIECITDNILKTDFSTFSGYVYVYVDGGGN